MSNSEFSADAVRKHQETVINALKVGGILMKLKCAAAVVFSQKNSLFLTFARHSQVLYQSKTMNFLFDF